MLLNLCFMLLSYARAARRSLPFTEFLEFLVRMVSALMKSKLFFHKKDENDGNAE